MSSRGRAVSAALGASLLWALLSFPLVSFARAPRGPAPAGEPAWVRALPARPVVSFRLPNGLLVRLERDRSHPRVGVSITYHVGWRDQPPGRRGIAHLVEHLLYQGSRHVREDGYFRQLERIGATEYNGATVADTTTLHAVVPASRLAVALWLESDRMAYVLDHVTAATLASQKQVIHQEWRERVASRPGGRIYEYVARALYPPGHPYRAPYDDPGELDAVTLPEVQRFVQRWYRPDNATLALVGDFDVAEARREVTRWFGSIRVQPIAVNRASAPAAALGLERRLVVASPAAYGTVGMVWLTPGAGTATAMTLDVVETLLAGDDRARLRQSVMTDEGIAVDVQAGQTARELGSRFEIDATVAPGHRTGELVAALDRALARLRAAPPSAEEVARAREIVERRLLFGAASLAARAERLSSAPAGTALTYVDAIRRMSAITPEVLWKTVRRTLPAHRRLVVRTVSSPGASFGGELRSQKDVP